MPQPLPQDLLDLEHRIASRRRQLRESGEFTEARAAYATLTEHPLSHARRQVDIAIRSGSRMAVLRAEFIRDYIAIWTTLAGFIEQLDRNETIRATRDDH